MQYRTVLSPGQTDSQVDASQRKFVKPELVYGLAKGGQTDRSVDAPNGNATKKEISGNKDKLLLERHLELPTRKSSY